MYTRFHDTNCVNMHRRAGSFNRLQIYGYTRPTIDHHDKVLLLIPTTTSAL